MKITIHIKGKELSTDLAIGVPEDSVVLSDDSAGAVNVLYASSSGFSATGQLPDKFVTQNYPNIEDSSETNNLFGDSLTARDLNADDRDDLAIGLSFDDVVSADNNAGAVNVIYSGPVGLPPTQSPVFDQFFSQDSPDFGLAPDPNDNFGSSLG